MLKSDETKILSSCQKSPPIDGAATRGFCKSHQKMLWLFVIARFSIVYVLVLVKCCKLFKLMGHRGKIGGAL